MGCTTCGGNASPSNGIRRAGTKPARARLQSSPIAYSAFSHGGYVDHSAKEEAAADVISDQLEEHTFNDDEQPKRRKKSRRKDAE